MSTASREIWNWREDGPRRRLERRQADLRRGGLIGGLVALAAGTLLNKVLGHELVGRLLVALGAVQTMAAIWRPLLLDAPQRWLARFGGAVGRGLAWLLLAPLWLVVFVPAGAWLNLRGRDPLHRDPLRPGLTAWIPRRRDPDAASLERQFLDEDPEARALQRPEGALPAADRAGGPPA
jgi:hypothetical protein